MFCQRLVFGFTFHHQQHDSRVVTDATFQHLQPAVQSLMHGVAPVSHESH